MFPILSASALWNIRGHMRRCYRFLRSWRGVGWVAAAVSGLCFIACTFWVPWVGISSLERATATTEKSAAPDLSVSLSSAAPTAWSCPFPPRNLSCQVLESLSQALGADGGRPWICLRSLETEHHPDRLTKIQTPSFFSWHRTHDVRDCEAASLFTVVIDRLLLPWILQQEARPSAVGFGVGLALEPPSEYSFSIDVLRDRGGWRHFDLVLTSLAEEKFSAPNVIRWSYGSSWIPADQWRIYEKDLMVSMTLSRKRFAEGHLLRYRIYETLVSRRSLDPRASQLPRDFVTFFGEGARRGGSGGSGYVGAKLDMLQRFRFAIVVENTREKYWFTEKIVDAFASGTVPIYWADRDMQSAVRETFDGDGIIFFQEMGELLDILSHLGQHGLEEYRRRLPHVEKNLELARRFRAPDDNLWLSYFECAFSFYHDQLQQCRASLRT